MQFHGLCNQVNPWNLNWKGSLQKKNWRHLDDRYFTDAHIAEMSFLGEPKREPLTEISPTRQSGVNTAQRLWAEPCLSLRAMHETMGSAVTDILREDQYGMEYVVHI